MGENELSSWLEKRRENVILKLVEKHISATADAVDGLAGAVEFCLAKKKSEMERALSRLDASEMAADSIRRKAMEALAKGTIRPDDRGDLMDLLSEVDDIADYAREAGRVLDAIYPFKGPAALADKLKKMCRTNVEATALLMNVIPAIVKTPRKALELCDEIERLEEETDELRAQARKELLHVNMGVGYVLLLSQLIESLEEVADRCEDSGDVFRIIAIDLMV